MKRLVVKWRRGDEPDVRRDVSDPGVVLRLARSGSAFPRLVAISDIEAVYLIDDNGSHLDGAHANENTYEGEPHV